MDDARNGPASLRLIPSFHDEALSGEWAGFRSSRLNIQWRVIYRVESAELAKASGVPQPAIAGIESGRIKLGADRCEKLARALKVHPAVLMWPQWDEKSAPRRTA